MFVLATFLRALAQLVDYVLWLYLWVVVIRAVLSWVNADPWNPIVRALRAVTDPVLRPVQRRLPVAGGVDFSPLVVILAIMFLQWFLVPVIREAAYRLS